MRHNIALISPGTVSEVFVFKADVLGVGAQVSGDKETPVS